jgi:hypothetical protein
MASAAVRADPPLSGGCGYQFGYQFPSLSVQVRMRFWRLGLHGSAGALAEAPLA